MLGEGSMRIYLQLLILVIGIFVGTSTQAEVMRILVTKEIDDDHIIIVTANGDQLLLEKWTMKLSPLSFEGKIFVADVSPMWVKIYIKDKGEIKWSIEKHLGTADLIKPPKNKTQKVMGYPYIGSSHWIQEISSGGKIIILEDGSLWEVSPIDVIYSSI